MPLCSAGAHLGFGIERARTDDLAPHRLKPGATGRRTTWWSGPAQSGRPLTADIRPHQQKG
jgi:hypothetical protein